MRRMGLVAASAMVTVISCAPHRPLAPSTPTHPSTQQLSQLHGADALPRSPDVAHEVIGWLVLSNGQRLAREMAPDPNLKPQAAATGLLSQLGLQPDIAALVDLSRPLGIALLNPSLLAVKSVQPYVALVPVRSRQEVEATLRNKGAPLEVKPYGFQLPMGEAKMSFAFVDGYCIVAWREDLLAAARRQLEPLLLVHHDAPLTVHMELDNIHEAFGPQLETLLGRVGKVAARGGAEGDPQSQWALRSIRQLTQQLPSVSSLELLGDIDSGGLTLTIRAEGREGGDFTGYVQQQQPGPAWGVQFLPRDSVLAYATHQSPQARAADLAASVQYLGHVSGPVEPAEAARVQHAPEQAAVATDGDLAYAVWPGRDGGVGLGGAYRINNAVAARAAVGEVYDILAPRLGAVVMRALGFDSDKLARKVHVAKRTVRYGDIEADLVDVSVAWPKDREPERRLFESLFGKRLTLATAFVGDRALFAIGADFDARLTAMISSAEGVPAASLGDEPAFAEALQYRPSSRVSLSYLETQGMARFAAGLVEQAGALDDTQQAAIGRMLASVGSGAIVSTTNTDGRRFEMTTHVPHSAIVGVAALDGALWRIALSPLVNPPMMPPLPVPPPHVTPSVNRAPVTAGTL